MLLVDPVADSVGAQASEQQVGAHRACPHSGQVATRLEDLGYANVREYPDGIQDWAEAGLPTGTGVPGNSSGPHRAGPSSGPGPATGSPSLFGNGGPRPPACPGSPGISGSGGLRTPLRPAT